MPASEPRTNTVVCLHGKGKFRSVTFPFRKLAATEIILKAPTAKTITFQKYILQWELARVGGSKSERTFFHVRPIMLTDHLFPGLDLNGGMRAFGWILWG